MPRIDPLQLLKCLSVLLTPEGGILSKEEVPRLVNLMTKFSKKLVSKCVYILILKNTEKSLVNMFMAEGGWNLIHTWLQDAIQISNWDLVKEILSLLLITPVDVERLKLNTIPKLVKGLTRVENCKGVQELSSQLVQDWLTIVKSNTVPKIEPCQPVENVTNEIKTVDINSVNKIQGSVNIPQERPEIPQQEATQQIEPTNNATVDSSEITGDTAAEKTEQEAISTNTFYKVTLRDGKQVISRTPGPDNEQNETKPETLNDTVKSEIKDKKDEKNQKSKSSSSSSKSSSSKHSSSSSKSSKSSSSSSSSSKDKHRSSSKSSSRDKDRDRKDRDKYKDKHKSNGSKHSSSSSSSSSREKSDSKEKQAEKDKDTLAKIRPQSIDKLGRIPKKTDDNKTKEIKKPTMSIEVRKNNEERPKTVKVYNSKRRSTGLEDEAKPAPPRPVKKQATPANVTTAIGATTITTTPSIIPPPKRQSPVRDLPVPPEKKLKIDLIPPPTAERPGAIKLIPPKPKPPVLQESDIFMDALAASASTKKESKKRKRRTSVTKDTPGSPTKQQQQQEPDTPTSPISSPLGLKNIAAPNFYQDTLNTEKTEDERNDEEDDDRVERGGGNTPTQNEEVEEKRTMDGGLRGALMYTKRKGPKKSVRFNDNDLTQVRFFELDETERVNVTKTFMDMAKMEMNSEREALQLSRKLANEDTMEVQTNWRVPYMIDIAEPLVIPGCKSLEKDIQFAREKTALQALYFDKRKIPDSPEEPIPEHHQMRDPIIIPLEDSETQEMDLRNTPWPEPKGSPPPPLITENNLPPQLFNNIQIPFQNFPNGPPQPFQGLPPRFPLGQTPQPGIFAPPNMLPNGNLLGPPNLGPQHDLLHQGGPLNPNAFGPGPGPDFNPMMNDNFQLPFNPPNMGMFPPNNFNMNRGGNRGGPGGYRRDGRSGAGNNNGGWVRLNNGPGNWNNRGPNRSGGGGGGGSGNSGRVCKNIKNHGFCRNMDKCPFIHPK